MNKQDVIDNIEKARSRFVETGEVLARGTLMNDKGCMCLIGLLGVVESDDGYTAPNEVVEATLIAVANSIEKIRSLSMTSVAITRCYNWSDSKTCVYSPAQYAPLVHTLLDKAKEYVNAS